MYCLETLKNLNDAAVLSRHIEDNPLVELTGIEDVRSAPDYAQVDLNLLEKVTRLKVVETFFVDSSGFGGESEPAMTYSRFLNAIKLLLKERQGKRLFACLSGIGQFQVYVTILMEKNKKKSLKRPRLRIVG